MKAIVQDRYGPSEVLRLREVGTPVPAAGEVLVRVHAVSLNARDWHTMRGDPAIARAAMGLRAPRVPIRGTDFAGVVESVGAGVTRFHAGAEVFGEVPGCFAEYVSAPEGLVEKKPAGLSFTEAAAIPLAGNTALTGLSELADVQPGQRVLINGASGGVGTYAVQIARMLGAHVTGVCSTRNADLVRSLGADEVIDYTAMDFTLGDSRYDVVFDLVGNRTLGELRRVLTPRGMLILSGGGVFDGGSFLGPVALIIRGGLAARFLRRNVVVLEAKPTREKLAALRDLAESKKITSVIDRSLSLSEAPEAMRYLEQDHARAKVVLTV